MAFRREILLAIFQRYLELFSKIRLMRENWLYPGDVNHLKRTEIFFQFAIRFHYLFRLVSQELIGFCDENYFHRKICEKAIMLRQSVDGRNHILFI